MNREAILRAADWLEANPHRHIQGALTNTNDCYCAAGRIGVEAGVVNFYGDYYLCHLATVTDIPLDTLHNLWRINDGICMKEAGFSSDWRAESIKYMRSIAA